MCQGCLNGKSSVSNTVNRAFSMSGTELEVMVANSVLNRKQSDAMRESLYYIAGWHAYAFKKQAK